jgi:hypothetical protein
MITCSPGVTQGVQVLGQGRRVQHVGADLDLFIAVRGIS